MDKVGKVTTKQKIKHMWHRLQVESRQVQDEQIILRHYQKD